MFLSAPSPNSCSPKSPTPPSHPPIPTPAPRISLRRLPTRAGASASPVHTQATSGPRAANAGRARSQHRTRGGSVSGSGRAPGSIIQVGRCGPTQKKKKTLSRSKGKNPKFHPSLDPITLPHVTIVRAPWPLSQSYPASCLKKKKRERISVFSYLQNKMFSVILEKPMNTKTEKEII